MLRMPSQAGRYFAKKVHPKRLQADVYFMASFHERASDLEASSNVKTPFGEAVDGEEHSMALDRAEGGGSAVRDTSCKRGAKRTRGSRVAAEACASEAELEGEPEQPPSGVAKAAVFRRRNSEDMRLARQFLSTALHSNVFMSVPVRNEEGDPS